MLLLLKKIQGYTPVILRPLDVKNGLLELSKNRLFYAMHFLETWEQWLSVFEALLYTLMRIDSYFSKGILTNI